MTNRINARQQSLINYVARNPGCTIMDVAKWDYSGKGHAASYAAVHRIMDRHLVLARRASNCWRLFADAQAWADWAAAGNHT